jgi:hypothetical protein
MTAATQPGLDKVVYTSMQTIAWQVLPARALQNTASSPQEQVQPTPTQHHAMVWCD